MTNSNYKTIASKIKFEGRAFINGKMDLNQAEAVADLIASENEGSHKLAMQQMKSGFSNDLKKLRAELLHFSSMIELELDFSQEDVEFAERKVFPEFKNLPIEDIEPKHRREGFEASNADKIFESTFIKQTDRK